MLLWFSPHPRIQYASAVPCTSYSSTPSCEMFFSGKTLPIISVARDGLSDLPRINWLYKSVFFLCLSQFLYSDINTYLQARRRTSAASNNFTFSRIWTISSTYVSLQGSNTHDDIVVFLCFFYSWSNFSRVCDCVHII